MLLTVIFSKALFCALTVYYALKHQIYIYRTMQSFAVDVNSKMPSTVDLLFIITFYFTMKSVIDELYVICSTYHFVLQWKSSKSHLCDWSKLSGYNTVGLILCSTVAFISHWTEPLFMPFFCSGGPDSGGGLTQTVAEYQRSGEARRWCSDVVESWCSLAEGDSVVTALAPAEWLVFLHALSGRVTHVPSGHPSHQRHAP